MLELKHISKIFPGVKALDDVSLTFNTGEIHALIGENGAGKSTLIKIITGIYQPDLGEIYLDGKQIVMKNFQYAVDHDINMVSQEISVIPDATVAENIVLDHLKDYNKGIKIDWKKINQTAEIYLKEVGLNVKATDKIGGMTAAQKQLIQIAKALASKAKYILLDEPTSSLTAFEVDNLIKIVKQLKEKQVAIIFVSHKIEEVLALCDKVSVLRDGKYVGTREVKDVGRQDIIKMMIGREENRASLGTLDIKPEKILEAKDIVSYGMFDHIGFHLNRGEILGFYGLVGSGRTELARIIFGADPLDEGEILVNGKVAKIHSIEDALEKYRIAYVTENRKEEGLILGDSVESNICITVWKRIRDKFKKISTKQEDEIADSMIKKIEIKTPTPATYVGTLSGGNQQKVSIGKWLAANCDILIIDEPTVGVDVGAKEYIHQLIWNLAKNEGKSIILISSDMPELIKLSRRILVFRERKIVGEITGLNDGSKTTQQISDEIGEYLA